MTQVLRRSHKSNLALVEPKTQFFGEFKTALTVAQQLDLVWHPYAGLKWGTASSAANYISNYFANALREEISEQAQAEISGNLNFVANELLENAIKFHFNRYLPLSCIVQQDENEFVLQVSNSVDSSRLPAFYRLIEELLSHDPAELFILHMENSLEVLSESTSGLGLITIMNDYEGKLGWRFETLAGLPGLPAQIVVTTLARIPLPL